MQLISRQIVRLDNKDEDFNGVKIFFCKNQVSCSLVQPMFNWHSYNKHTSTDIPFLIHVYVPLKIQFKLKIRYEDLM